MLAKAKFENEYVDEEDIVKLYSPRGGWPRLTFGHQGRLMNGSHVRNRGAQIEESGIFSLAV